MSNEKQERVKQIISQLEDTYEQLVSLQSFVTNEELRSVEEAMDKVDEAKVELIP